MKEFNQNLKVIIVVIISVSIMSFLLSSFSNKIFNKNEFEIIVIKEEKSFKFIGLKGCKWNSKKVYLEKNSKIYISENGIYKNEINQKNSNFGFALNYDKDIFKLNSINGTNWISLSAESSNKECIYSIDKNGIIVK